MLVQGILKTAELALPELLNVGSDSNSSKAPIRLLPEMDLRRAKFAHAARYFRVPNRLPKLSHLGLFSIATSRTGALRPSSRKQSGWPNIVAGRAACVLVFLGFAGRITAGISSGSNSSGASTASPQTITCLNLPPVKKELPPRRYRGLVVGFIDGVFMLFP
jgi:hypothetical protein